MENPNQPSANDMLNKMQMVKFSAVFKTAFALVKKNPLMLFLVFAIPILISGVLQQFAFPAIDGVAVKGGVFVVLVLQLVYMLIGACISLFGAGALVRTTQMVNDSKAVNIAEVFGYVRSHFVDAVKLAIRLFIYTGAWILIAYMLVMGILTTLGLYSGKAGVGLIGLAGLLAFLFIFVVIAYVVLFFKKIVNASFANIFFFTSEHPQVEESLQSSLRISQNLTWTIFGNYVLMGLVGWLIAFVLALILTPIFLALHLGGGVDYSTGAVSGAAGLLSALIGSVVGVITFAFQYKLKEQIEAFKGGSSAPAAHHAAPAHHEAPAHHAAPTHTPAAHDTHAGHDHAAGDHTGHTH